MFDAFSSYVRGFVVGAGFILLVEVLLVLAACFVLFDPMRKTVVPPPPEFSTAGIIDGGDATTMPPSGNRITATHSRARDLINEHEESWPENIVEFLMLALSPTDADTPVPPRPTASGGKPSPLNDYIVDPVAIGPTDPCPWANVVAARFFLALRESELFKSRMKAKMTERMNMKLKNNSFVSHVRILDISLGDYAPKIHGVRLMKGVTDDLAVVLEVDATYAGGGSVALEVTLTAGLSVPVRVYLSSLAGKLRVRFPSIGWPDMLAIAFVEDPGASFRVDSPITVFDNEMVRGMVNKLIAGVMRKVFLDMWVLPGCRNFFLPLMTPTPVEELSRMNIANIPRPPVHRRPVPGASGKSQESTLWQNRSKVHSIEKQGTVQQIPLAFLDCVSSQAHQLDMTISSSSNQATIDNIGNDLIAAFLTLARDADSKVGPLDGSSTAPSEKITPASLAWKIVKDRQGVCVQKRRLVAPGFQSELTKATISIDCDSERVYSILSHPEHFRHVEETYMASSIFRQFSESASIRHSQFMLGRNILKDYLVFEVKCKVDSTGHDSSSLEPTRQTSFIVVMRSIAGYKEDSAEPLIDLKSHPEDTLATDSVPPEDHDSMNQVKTKITGDEPPELMVSSGAAISDDLAIINTDDAAKIIEARTIPAVEESTSDPTAQAVAVSQNTLLPPEPPTSVVYLYGYLIEPSSTDANSCRVTVLSQLSPDISRLEANFNTCRKLKNFVEEYVALSSRAQSTSTSSSSSLLSYAASELRKRRMFTTGVEGGEKRIDKLKNLVSSTAGYLMKNKRTPGWFGAAGASLESGVGQDDASSMDSRVENASDVDEAAFRGVDDVDSISAREDLFNFEETAVPSQSYESRGFIVSEDLQRHKTLNEQEANGLTRDSSSISTSSAPTVSSSLMSKVSDIVTGELMTSAAAIARTVTKKRSLTFLKKLPGTQGDASEDEAEPMGAVRATVDETTKSDIPVGDSLDPALYQEKRIFGREIVREDLSFTRRTDGGHAEFSWEFFLRGEAQITFSLVFRPENRISSEEHILTLFPPSQVDKGDRQIVPAGSVTAPPSKPFRGTISVSSFPSGTFIFVWDNTSGSKKGVKDLVYRSIFRPFQLVLSPGLPLRPIGAGYSGEVNIPRKSLFRVSVVYDASVEVAESMRPVILMWDFSTHAIDVMFSVLFFADEDSRSSVSTIAASSQPLQNDVGDPGILESTESTPPAKDNMNPEHLPLTDVRLETFPEKANHSPPPKPARLHKAPVVANEDQNGEVVSAMDEVAPTHQPQIPPRPPLRPPLLADPSNSRAPPPKPPRRDGPAVPDRPSLASRLAAVAGDRSDVESSVPFKGSSGETLSESESHGRSSLAPTHEVPPLSSSPSSSSVLSGYLSRQHARPLSVISPTKVKTQPGMTFSGSVPVTGRHGVYSFIWDNSHSVVLPKTVTFKAAIVLAKEENVQ